MLLAHIREHIAQSGGWISFADYMALCLYAPALGYYMAGARKLGAEGDFITAPELSPLFGQCLAQWLMRSDGVMHPDSDGILEIGAGTGVLAAAMLEELEQQQALPARYFILELSADLRQRARDTLAARVPHLLERVTWLNQLPPQFKGLVLGNEVLDAMPVHLLARVQGQWHERGVVWSPAAQRLVFADRPTTLAPPLPIEGTHDYCTELHAQAEAFMRTVADRLHAGLALFIDYGFPESEYYHPQRHMGTLVCHRAHQTDSDPLVNVGAKDITAHVNFTGIALAAQDAGLPTLGYTSQARFLMNCGLVNWMADADLRGRADALKLITEHEMGELFKVIALSPAADWTPLGFVQGDRTHTL